MCHLVFCGRLITYRKMVILVTTAIKNLIPKKILSNILNTNIVN
ncbi:unnamed protein product [Aphis gossypii]|uniref:Uncharacterized protein n=1 Tax=Aphis gossypii TaxID=80765 RepID=A0A9P0JDD2_APHGO|nr:unnamed protein product [Aphis gossypii]CAH1736709.1 unnamed protein product [Aphis gossypii]